MHMHDSETRRLLNEAAARAAGSTGEFPPEGYTIAALETAPDVRMYRAQGFGWEGPVRQFYRSALADARYAASVRETSRGE